MKAKIVGIEKKRGGEWRLSFAIAAPAGVRRMSFRIKEEKCKELDTLEIGEVLDEERYLLFAVEEEKRAALDKAVQILSMGVLLKCMYLCAFQGTFHLSILA